MKIQKNEFLTHGGGLLEVLKIATPLILASSAHAINLFSDRVMLSWYSEKAVAGAFASGLTSFTLCCFFFGIISYTNSFVAQYSGAGANRRVGTAVWQGIFLSIIGGALVFTGWFWGEWLFKQFGHTPEVVEQEVVYFKLLCAGGILLFLNTALSCFWSGRGKTGMVMIVNILVTCLNIPFNYALIFGHWGCPELGIAGAAWGTNLSAFAGLLIYAWFFFVPKSSRRHFSTCSNIFDLELFIRMIRYGTPNGVQFFIDLASFNVFIVVLGQYGQTIQAASSIAFGLNSIAFTPILGIGQTVAILVGQAVGAGDIEHAKRSVRSARTLTLLYMGIMAILFVVRPEWILWIFSTTSLEVIRNTKIMLCFISAYLLFDGLFIVYSNAIKAAGDTFFAMVMGASLAVVMLAIPSALLSHYGYSVWIIWTVCVIYIIVAGSIFYGRYRGGKWTKMKVIENTGTLPLEQDLLLKD